MYYGFKPNPKQLVTNKARALFGDAAKIVVNGARVTPALAKEKPALGGTYYVECVVDGKLVASTSNKDWRKAYKLLVVAVETAYEASLHNVT